jgi:hypothetical protein
MSRQQQTQRYTRTERRPQPPAPHVDPEVERFEEERSRYGGFAVVLVALLVVATIAAIVGTIVFWPD